MQRTATPRTPVRFRPAPPLFPLVFQSLSFSMLEPAYQWRQNGDIESTFTPYPSVILTSISNAPAGELSGNVSAYLPQVQTRWPRCRGAARQRTLSSRRRYRGARGFDAQVQPAHHPAPAHRYLLRLGRENQRAQLRQTPRLRRSPDSL